jgi:hypothetical protein
MRLVKNRQAAQQFRKRQKLYIQDLERRCSSLSAQNASYGYCSYSHPSVRPASTAPVAFPSHLRMVFPPVQGQG